MIYANKINSIISYNFINNQKISEIKNAHNEYITNFRHYYDKEKNQDLIISISSYDNNIKLWNIYNWNCICDIKNINQKGNLYSACFLHDINNNTNFIVTSNDNYSKSEFIKIFDFNGKKIKEIKNSNKRTFFIDTYYDFKLSKLFIITGNDNYVLSYDYNDDKIYYKYSDNDKDIDEINPHDSIIMINDAQIVKMIESSEDGNIRIWDFHHGLLLKKIFISECKIYGIC